MKTLSSTHTAVANRIGERGATMVFIAASMFLLIGIAAFVVDLSGIRLDRAVDQRVTDAAATAGAISVFNGDGETGCQTALGYVAVNASEINPVGFDTTCPNIATIASCDPTTLPQTDSKVSGRYTISVTYPVPDGDALMTSAAIGAPTQAVTAADRDQCSRIGVRVLADRQTMFGQVLGSQQNATTVHSVAVAYRGLNASTPVNLLLLDRTACHAMRASGLGGILVNKVVDPPNTYPGIGASDSDGSECTGVEDPPLSGVFLNGVIYTQGANAIIRADGPTGCGSPIDTGAGEGCGILQAFTPTFGTCIPLACQSDGPPSVDPRPIPTTLPARITREPIDHRYNCYSDYLNPPGGVLWASDPLTAPQYDINNCVGGQDNIYDHILAMGETGPVGFNSWVGTYGPSCEVLPAATVTAPGDWHIDCSPFNVKGTLRIQGNVLFDGDVNVTSSTGNLIIDNPPGTGKDGEGFAFFRDSVLTKDGDASLTFDHTFVYMARKTTTPSSAKIAFAGGSGALVWVAPTKGPFEDLALWSDSPIDHEWAGQATLDMEGTFFVPWARVQYSGLSAQDQLDAQFIAARLWARGNGFLVLTPSVGRSTPVDIPIVAELIR